MRVITGTARGRRLVAPAGAQTRPTSEIVKEAVFSIIQFELEGAHVLDLFAGSGQMGIEALSRGAAFCAFVDREKESQQAVRDNLKSTGFAGRARLFGADALSYLQGCAGGFDIAFLDPPYKKGMSSELLPRVAEKMRPGGVILYECEKREALPERAGDFLLHREYRYGSTKVALYRPPEEE